MDILKNIWAKIILGLTFVVGILLIVLRAKNVKLDAFKARIQLTKTKEEALALEKDIINKMAERKNNKKEVDKLKDNLVKLREKKKSIAVENGSKTDKEIEDYWS